MKNLKEIEDEIGEVSQQIVSREVCIGLSDICFELVKYTKNKKEKDAFKTRAKVFKDFSKIFGKLILVKKRNKTKTIQLENQRR